MNILQKLFPSLFQQKAVPFSTGQRYEIVNGQIINSPDNKRSYLTNGYNINDIIYSIVNLISDKIRLAPWQAYKIVDEQKAFKYWALIRKKDLGGDDLIKAKDLFIKAFEPYDGDGRLTELLKYPNSTDTFNDIVANSSINKMLLGARLIHAQLLGMGANTGLPHSLNLLPTQEISLIVSRSWPHEILGYRFDCIPDLTFTKEQILHDRFHDPNYDTTGGHLFGLAPLKAALGLTTRSNAENTAATMAYQNGGPRSIIFVDEPQWPADQRGIEAKEVKRILTSKEYTGAKNNNKIASSGYKMGVVPLGLSPVELDIIASEKWSLRRFCNVFGGVPSQTMNDPDNKVYSNMTEGEKALTTRGAIPHLNSFRDSFNRKLGTDWGYKGKNIYCDYDVTVFSELQENMKDKWSWVERLPVTNGYKLDLMGLDHPEGEEEFMKQILVPSGFELSESYGENDTDRALAQGDGEIPE